MGSYRKTEYRSEYGGEKIVNVVLFFERNWEKDEYREICRRDDRRGVMWRKVEVWRMEGIRTDRERGIWLTFMEEEEEELWHILKCERWKG
jgi:hypothetical protein